MAVKRNVERNMKNPPRVIFITSSLGREGKNFEHIMRVHFLSRITELIVICPKGADFSEHADIGTVVVNSCFPGKMGVIIEAIRWLSMKKNRRPAVVVITEPSVIGLVGFVAKVAFALPWVVDVWDIPLRYLGTKPFKLLKNQLTKALFRHLYRSADLFIVGIRPDMGFRYFRVPQEKILQWQTTICVPENPPDYQPKNENLPFRLLCMRSNHNRNMGLDVLGDAFSILEKKIPNIRLWIVGTIDEDVEKSITTLRASTRVTFTGFMKHPELMKLINEVDCCVIPWRDVEDLAQTYPAKVMEYLTQGKILVAARIKGISEMIDDGYNGLLFTPGNHIELAEKIETLIHNEKLRKYISTNAKVYNEKFDGKLKNQCIVDRLIKICENICSSGDVSGEGTSQNGLNVVFVCPARPKPGDANMNYYQRAYFLSRKTNLTILAPYGADYS
ncbi:MAG TPA: glycosyltransferase, partial [Nitrospirota bacterium]|nr:glycosyltransferase [Nitrospirota bacterium]